MLCETHWPGCKTSTGTRATSVCLRSMGWDLITKLNLWLLLSTLPVVIQTGLITPIPECCPCSPSTETYLAPADFTLLQPAVSSSSRRWLFQNKSPTFSGHTTVVSRPLPVPVILATARQGYENSCENWRRTLLWSLMDLFCYQFVLWGSP